MIKQQICKAFFVKTAENLQISNPQFLYSYTNEWESYPAYQIVPHGWIL